MARQKELTLDESRALLFERLRASKATIVATTARDTDIEEQHIGPAFEQLTDLVTEPVPTAEQLARWREEGERLARAGAAAERVLDGYLSLNWATWEVVMQQEEIPRAIILDFADRLLRGLDDAIAAMSEGYIRVEVEAAAAHSEQRRAVLEDLLAAPRATARDRARIRLRARRYGLEAEGGYRLVLIHVPGVEDTEVEALVDRLEARIRAPVPYHRDRPGIRLPVVLDWRGHVLVFATAAWTGVQRLREALPQVLGSDIVVIDTGVIDGIETLSDALTRADYSATVAAALGRRGWIGDPGSLALETTFLQLALQRESADLPLLQRATVFTGYAEGWALYAERLAAEAGLYADDPVGDIGRLRMELLRAGRAVTDTGIHALGWSRDEAIDYLVSLGLPQAWAVSEVDRYIVWPGQAPTYLIGMLEILRLREEAQAALGDDFDLAGFHDALLRHGSVPLAVLPLATDAWVESVG